MEKVENNISVIFGSVAGMFGFAILFQVRNGINFFLSYDSYRLLVW